MDLVSPWFEITIKNLVFILDVWETVFIWIGSESNKTEQSEVQDLAKEYLQSSPSNRKGTPIVTVQQGMILNQFCH